LVVAVAATIYVSVAGRPCFFFFGGGGGGGFLPSPLSFAN
jgi:hypothetical protein